MRGIEDLINEAPVFAGLTPAQLELIAGCAANEHVAAGEYLLREGEPAERFYLLRHGSVALEVHAPGRGAILIETFDEGDVIGWSWLFEPYRWQFDARATAPSRLVGFDGLCLRGKCEADHELGYQLMRRFAASIVARLQAARLQLLDLYGRAPVG